MTVLPFPQHATRRIDNDSQGRPLTLYVGSLVEFGETCRAATKRMKNCLEDTLVAIEHQIGTMDRAIALVEDAADREKLMVNMASLSEQLASTRRTVGLL